LWIHEQFIPHSDDIDSHHSPSVDRQQVIRYKSGSILFCTPNCSSLFRHNCHSPWFVFPTYPLHTSTFLPPFAPHPLQCFLALMEALTPDKVTPFIRYPWFMHLVFQPFRLQPPVAPYHRFITLPLSLIDFLLFFLSRRSGLRHSLAGSPLQQAESSSSFYGLAFHLPLLPTPSHDDAVTVGYRYGKRFTWRGLPPLWHCALSGALARVVYPPHNTSTFYKKLGMLPHNLHVCVDDDAFYHQRKTCKL